MKNKAFSRKFVFSMTLTVAVLISAVSPVFAKTKQKAATFQQGFEYEQNEEFYSASQCYLEVVEKNPADVKVWYHLALCSYKLGEFDLALQYVENSEKYDRDNRDIQNLKGMIFISTGKTKEASKLFYEILKKYPNDIDAHFGLAELELLEGRFSGAEIQYTEALKRQSTNRKALLSMALVCAENGKFEQAEKYLNASLQYYSGQAEVHYLSAVIYSIKGDFKMAERQARIAVEINGNYEKAYELLSAVLYQQGRYAEVIDISDFLISRNRNNSNAWYLKGIALDRTGNFKEAINVWTTGLSINPQDELMRFNLEMEVRDNLSLEDRRRSNWAKYHVDNAKQYAQKYDGAGAVYEYQRALLLDPMNYDARIAYAEILELNGMHELYLDQLKFIKEHNFDNISKNQKTELSDKIEAFDDLLSDTLGNKWSVEPFYLDKTRWNIAVFYEENGSSFIHADTNRLVARAASDIFSGVAITSVKTQVTPVSGYGEAFKNARAGKFDYFVILSLSEGQNDLTLSSAMYSGRTGLQITDDTFYSTGNNRFATVLRRFRNSVLEKLSVKGKIIDRNGKTVLLDLGKSENIVPDTQFKIVKKGEVRTADNGIGLYYRDNDVVGTVTVTKAGEEISEANIDEYGFYDKVNIDDEVVLVYLPPRTNSGSNAIDNVPAADENGNAVIRTEVKGDELVEEIRRAVERPSILDLLRDIY
ncbi:MAG: tetratricopeptide repeat protein [Treponema sp.]|nr:tetratricopeptide repeat protein [Treponema sp.]